FAQNPPQPSFPILSAEHLIGVDLEDGDGQVVPESRGPTYLPVKQVFQVATAVSAGLTIAGRGLFGLDPLASHHDRVKALGDALIERAQRFLEVVARQVIADHDGAEGAV